MLAIMDMYELLGKKSPQAYSIEIANKFKQCRKKMHITQKELAKKTLVPYATIRYFEETGKVNLLTLLILAESLDLLSDFNRLFNPDNHISYEELTHGR